jgi:hypothetical protein
LGRTSATVLLGLVLVTAGPAAGAQKPAATDDIKITLAGDSIVNRKLSVFDDPASTGLFNFIRQSDAVTPGGNVAGTTTDQATFMLDGGKNTFDMDGTGSTYTTSFAASTTGGLLGQPQAGTMPMPQDSIEEFKVSTTGQTADFNNSAGSETQAITRRGHDNWH